LKFVCEVALLLHCLVFRNAAFLREDSCILGCSAVQTGISLPTFQRIIAPMMEAVQTSETLVNLVYTALQPTIQPSTYSSPWEPQIRLVCLHVNFHVLYAVVTPSPGNTARLPYTLRCSSLFCLPVVTVLSDLSRSRRLSSCSAHIPSLSSTNTFSELHLHTVLILCFLKVKNTFQIPTKQRVNVLHVLLLWI
jgi:hypothetical protein